MHCKVFPCLGEYAYRKINFMGCSSELSLHAEDNFNTYPEDLGAIVEYLTCGIPNIAALHHPHVPLRALVEMPLLFLVLAAVYQTLRVLVVWLAHTLADYHSKFSTDNNSIDELFHFCFSFHRYPQTHTHTHKPKSHSTCH